MQDVCSTPCVFPDAAFVEDMLSTACKIAHQGSSRIKCVGTRKHGLLCYILLNYSTSIFHWEKAQQPATNGFQTFGQMLKSHEDTRSSPSREVVGSTVSSIAKRKKHEANCSGETPDSGLGKGYLLVRRSPKGAVKNNLRSRWYLEGASTASAWRFDGRAAISIS